MSRRQVGDADSVMQASHVILGWDEGYCDHPPVPSWGQWRYIEGGIGELLLCIEFRESQHSRGIKVIPALYCFGSSGLSRDDGLAVWPQLSQCLTMAVIWLILRDNNDIRFVNLGEMLYARWNDVFGDGKPRCSDDGVSLKPWINQDTVNGVCGGHFER